MISYWFTSSLFQIEPGEDAEINPGIYGRQLATWLKKQLEERGYSVEPIINEDWGRCLMCSREPVMLWVGCANASDPKAFGQAPHERPVIWHCFAVAEVPFWKRVFHFSKPNTATALSKLHGDLGAILQESSEVNIVEEP